MRRVKCSRWAKFINSLWICSRSTARISNAGKTRFAIRSPLTIASLKSPELPTSREKDRSGHCIQIRATCSRTVATWGVRSVSSAIKKIRFYFDTARRTEDLWRNMQRSMEDISSSTTAAVKMIWWAIALTWKTPTAYAPATCCTR